METDTAGKSSCRPNIYTRKHAWAPHIHDLASVKSALVREDAGAQTGRHSLCHLHNSPTLQAARLPTVPDPDAAHSLGAARASGPVPCARPSAGRPLCHDGIHNFRSARPCAAQAAPRACAWRARAGRGAPGSARGCPAGSPPGPAAPPRVPACHKVCSVLAAPQDRIR